MTKISSEDKLRELILHVMLKSADDPKCGLVKLNKILAFSDFLYYANYGRPITGEKYVKCPQGPMPADFKKVKKEMIKNKDVVPQPVPVVDFSREKLIPTRNPKYEMFTADEIAFVDKVIEKLKQYNAAVVSELSHDVMVGWQNVGIGEEIPYETVFFPVKVTLSEEDKYYSLELIKKYGWDKQYGWTL